MERIQQLVDRREATEHSLQALQQRFQGAHGERLAGLLALQDELKITTGRIGALIGQCNAEQRRVMERRRALLVACHRREWGARLQQSVPAVQGPQWKIHRHWQSAQGSELHTTAISPCGRFVALSILDRKTPTLRVVDVAEERVTALSLARYAFAFSADSRWLIPVGSNRVWNCRTRSWHARAVDVAAPQQHDVLPDRASKLLPDLVLCCGGTAVVRQPDQVAVVVLQSQPALSREAWQIWDRGDPALREVARQRIRRGLWQRIAALEAPRNRGSWQALVAAVVEILDEVAVLEEEELKTWLGWRMAAVVQEAARQAVSQGVEAVEEVERWGRTLVKVLPEKPLVALLERLSVVGDLLVVRSAQEVLATLEGSVMKNRLEEPHLEVGLVDGMDVESGLEELRRLGRDLDAQLTALAEVGG